MEQQQRSVPSKQTIEDAHRAKSTSRTYRTYQNQFLQFCKDVKSNLNPELATPVDCTDFFHHLYGLGKTARTVDSAKTSLVAYYKERRITPNPAQHAQSKQYVVGLKKYNKQHNIDDEKKAHPISVHELSVIMNALSVQHVFVGSMYRFLLCAAYLGCFRMGEMLSLTWDDVALNDDDKGKFVSIRLRWHKKASVTSDCQIYYLVDESVFPCLNICAMYSEYLKNVRKSGHNIASSAFVFPALSIASTGALTTNWYKKVDSLVVANQLKQIVESNGDLNTGISLHSLRRGGSFFRVFESPQRRFNFRELMAWCRWEDAKTCCEYLITRSISDSIDPTNLLRIRQMNDFAMNLESRFINTVRENNQSIQINHVQSPNVVQQSKIPKPIKSKQSTLDTFVAQSAIPTASSAKEAWNQWFNPIPELGLFRSIRSFSKDMIRQNRRKYSERLTLASAFQKYTTYDSFERSYSGFTLSYSSILKEVRKRKRENCL